MLNGTKNRSQTTASTLARREGKFCHLSDWLVIERGCRIRCAWATGLSGWRLGPLCKDHSVWGFDGRAWGLWAQGVDTHGLSQPAGGHEARSHPWRPVRHPASQIWKGEDVGGGRWSQAKATWESRGADLLGLEQGRWKAGRVHWLGEGTGRGWVCKVELACSPKESIFHLVHVCVRAKMSVPTTLEKAQSIFRRQLGRQSTGPTRSITGATLTPEGFYAQCAGNAFASHQLQCCDYVRYNSHIMKLTILKGFQDVHQQWRLHRAEDRCWAPWKSLESKPVWPANLTWDSGLSLFLQSQAIWRKAETGELYQTQTLRNRGVRRERVNSLPCQSHGAQDHPAKGEQPTLFLSCLRTLACVGSIAADYLGDRERADPHLLPSKAGSLWPPAVVRGADGFSEEKADLCMSIEGWNFI